MWRHVPSEKNSGDLVSPGCNASHLKDDTESWEGSSFLRKHEEHWPAQEQFHVSKFDDTEVKKVSQVMVNIAVIERVGIDQVIEVQKFNGLFKLLKVTSYVLKPHEKEHLVFRESASNQTWRK